MAATLALWSLIRSSIFARHLLALQFPVPTPIFLLSASKVKQPSCIAAMMVPALMLRQRHTFLKLSIKCFFDSKIYIVPVMIQTGFLFILNIDPKC